MSVDDLSPVGEARSLGPTWHGGEHWLGERMTSAALLLLGVWLLASLLWLNDFEQPTIAEWLRSPWGAVPMALFIYTAFRHSLDGLKVVVDDYVHDQGNRLALHGFLLFAHVGGGALALFALARIALGSTQ